MSALELTHKQGELLKEKVDFEELGKVWKNFEKFAMYDDLKDLYMKTVPEIFRFEGKIEEFKRDIEKQNEILLRFDEVLSEKASKANMRDLAQECNKLYAPILDFNLHKT